MTDDSPPWAMGLTVAGFVAAVTAAAVVVLSLGLTRVHPLLAVGLNLVGVGRAGDGGRGSGADGVGMAKAAGVAGVRAGFRRRRRRRVARAVGDGARNAQPMSASANLACQACSSSAPKSRTTT